MSLGWSDVGELAARGALLGLFAGAVVQVLKTVVRVALVAASRFPAEGTPARSAWRDSVRAAAVLVGGCVGLLDVWPRWAGWQPAYGPIIGTVGGMLSAALYDAVYRVLDAAPDTVIDTFRARFGLGAASKHRAPRASANPIDTQPMQQVVDQDAAERGDP